MASLGLSAKCISHLRSLRTSRAAAARIFSTAAAPHGESAPRRTPLQHRHSDNHLRRHATSDAHFISDPRYNATPSGFAALPHRRLIAVSGPDAAKFLQGLLTNNVNPKHSLYAFYSAFLDARGRVLWDVWVWSWSGIHVLEPNRDASHWMCCIEVDEAEAEALIKHLKRHKLRSKVQIEDVSDRCRVWAAWGTPVLHIHEEVLTRRTDPRGPSSVDMWPSVMSRYVARADQQTIMSGEERSNICLHGPSVPTNVDDYHMQRYRYGIPEGPKEIVSGSALPMECNLDLWSGIDFKKGCYLGQELTIRTKHTGVVRKRILPVEIYGAGSYNNIPENGTDIKELDTDGNLKKGRATGKFIAGMGNKGIALCRLESMTSMKVSAEGGTWKPGMEFGCQTASGVVRVKPVLHGWFVENEREMWGKNRASIQEPST
ncbi:Aminomethyltransferase folate-binding domain-containing protein [Clathrospora elynae]|uniref:Iron-sulfur cluster assembly factor IBA57 homolog, mitochondrial n=1 Tax=Clathrospora elynae TaxID=706981 RepID=A0A6A5SLF8_9PLEO|nr:Aminomethyltransferase folate-binding domain-containing protein [Clathrospora elynae]